MQPLVTPKDAAPVALLMAAQYARGDVAFPEQARRTNEKELYARAAAGRSAASGTRAPGSSSTTPSSAASSRRVEPLRSSRPSVPAFPQVTEQLARVYGRLGWRAERMRTVKDLAQRFPDDRDALALYLTVARGGRRARRGRQGRRAHQEARSRRGGRSRSRASHVATGRRRSPSSVASRSAGPIARRSPARIADVLVRVRRSERRRRAAREGAREEPRRRRRRASASPITRTRRATRCALRRALAEALQAGSKGIEIREAVELLEGASLLEPYRNGRPQGHPRVRGLGEVAASTWTAPPRASSTTRRRGCIPDGSSEMLEHEILRMQSQEAVDKEAEQQPPDGLVLRPPRHQAGRLDPRARARRRQADADDAAPRGRRLLRDRAHHGDRRAKARRASAIAARTGSSARPTRATGAASSSSSRRRIGHVDIETVGKVPQPKTAENGHVHRAPMARRRVAARRRRAGRAEPARVPAERARRLGHQPRRHAHSLRRRRERGDAARSAPRARSRATSSEEHPAHEEGRARSRPLQLGRRGAPGRATRTTAAAPSPAAPARASRRSCTCAPARHETELALVKSRIAMPPAGKMSEVETYDNVVARLETDGGAALDDRPRQVRAVRLRPRRAARTARDPPDSRHSARHHAGARRRRRRAHRGQAILKDDGSATVDIAQSYVGRMGIGLRAVFDRVPEAKRNEFVETRLLANNLPGARLKDLRDGEQGRPRGAARPAHEGEVPQIARQRRRRQARPEAALPGRHRADRVAPAAADAAAPRELVARRGALPDPRARRRCSFPASLPGGELRDGDRSVDRERHGRGPRAHARRVVDIPAGRVQPGAEYARFVAFTQQADGLLEKEIALGR